MTKFEKALENTKQIVKSDCSEEELEGYIKNKETQLVIAYYSMGGVINVYYQDTKIKKQFAASNIQVFMKDSSLNFREYELFTSGKLAYLIIHKRKFYIFIKNEEDFKIYTVSGKFAIWIDILNDDDRECIMFEPENEQNICLLDVFKENHLHPMAGDVILNKLENRLKRKYESELK